MFFPGWICWAWGRTNDDVGVGKGNGNGGVTDIGIWVDFLCACWKYRSLWRDSGINGMASDWSKWCLTTFITVGGGTVDTRDVVWIGFE